MVNIFVILWTLLGLGAGAVVATLIWVVRRATVMLDEMVRQDYESFAERLGDILIALAARVTSDPEARLEEWLSVIAARRAHTGKPCLPDALSLLLAAVKPDLGLAPRRPTTVAPSRMDDDLGSNVLNTLFVHWIDAELGRRGLAREQLRAALVIMPPGTRPIVLLNHETQWTAQMRATRAIDSGELVYRSDIQADSLRSVRPIVDDPDAGWAGFVEVGDAQWIVFDFRRNRGRSARLLEVAAADLEIARRLRAHSFVLRPGSLVSHLYSAADAAATVHQLLLEIEPDGQSDTARARAFRDFARHGNVDWRESRGYDRLRAVRKSWLRHALTTRQLDELITAVSEMVESAKCAVGIVEPARNETARDSIQL